MNLPSKPLKTKLTPRERRHAKQVATLLRWHKKVKQAIDTLAKSKTAIPRLEKALQRYDKMMLMAPLEKVEPAGTPQLLEGPAPQVASDEPVAVESVPESKPKRKRKPKTDSLGLEI